VYLDRPDRFYRLQSSMPVAPLAWMDVPPFTNMAGTGSTTTLTHSAAATALLYRLSVGVPW
jgi:hypothetical protein